MCKRILYISYDGVLEPLGQSQVLRYLEMLSSNNKIFLISFEKKDNWLSDEAQGLLIPNINKSNIYWMPLRYHKSPTLFATAFDIIQGIIIGAWICFRHKVEIIHARSYIASIMATFLKKIFKVKFIFDMRGFWADERIDGGIWPKNKIYYFAKRFEKVLLLSSDCTISLTNAAVKEMKNFPYLYDVPINFKVITTCTDLEFFNYGNSNEKQHHSSFVLGYVGSVGVWYLFDETLRCFLELRRQIPNARMHILNRENHDYIYKQLYKFNVPVDSVIVESATREEVVKAMNNMDAGIFIIKPSYSKIASAPTKLGEFLGCGVPCLGNSMIGDMEHILKSENVGVVLNDFNSSSIKNSIEKLIELTKDNNIKVRCREAALRHFSLDDCVKKYENIYNSLS